MPDSNKELPKIVLEVFRDDGYDISLEEELELMKIWDEICNERMDSAS